MYEKIKDGCAGALVMDTKGIYDAMTRNISSLHGLRSSRAGYELTLAVLSAKRIGTVMRWVNGMAQLGDCLTKFAERKVFLQFLAANQTWRLIHDEKFTAGRKLRKRELEKATQQMEENFIMMVRDMAIKNRWPWDDFRSMGDVRMEDPLDHGIMNRQPGEIILEQM